MADQSGTASRCVKTFSETDRGREGEPYRAAPRKLGVVESLGTDQGNSQTTSLLTHTHTHTILSHTHYPSPSSQLERGGYFPKKINYKGSHV